MYMYLIVQCGVQPYLSHLVDGLLMHQNFGCIYSSFKSLAVRYYSRKPSTTALNILVSSSTKSRIRGILDGSLELNPGSCPGLNLPYQVA